MSRTSRPTTVVFACLTLAIATVAGCADRGSSVRRPATTLTEPAPDTGRAGSQGPAALAREIERELGAMRDTRYQHTTRVDETTGTFFYDCSGLVDYALSRVVPEAVRALPTSTSDRPLAGDIEHYFQRGLTGPIDGWQALAGVGEVRRGDVVAWLATEDSTTGDTGHVMVVLAAPTRNPKRGGEWLVHIADSTLHPHAGDSRHPGSTGLGTGTIGLVADEDGAPTAFYWEGGISRHAKPTEIALGRLR